MKKLILSLTVVGVLGAGDVQAALLVKKKSTASVVATTAMGSKDGAMTYKQMVASAENHSINSRLGLVARMLPRAQRWGVTVPKLLYIFMAVIGLGWLAIGINDTFSTWSWVIAFFLYCFFFLPGVIYTLVMMRGYYL